MKLEEYLKENSLSGRAFARLCGIESSLLSRYINGKNSPTAQTMAIICRATNGIVQPVDFIDWAEVSGEVIRPAVFKFNRKD